MMFFKYLIDSITVFWAIYMLFRGFTFAYGTLGSVWGGELAMLVSLTHLVALMTGLAGLLVIRHGVDVLAR